MAESMEVGGKRIPKWAAYGGIGVAVVGGILYVRHKNGGGSAGQNQNATDPVTGLPYSMDNQVDPATGMTYLAEAQQYGSVSAAQAAISAGYGGVSGAGYGYSGLGYGSPASGGYSYSATGTASTYATNADWAQAVTAQLPSITGDSQSDCAAAIAGYLAGLPLTAQQAQDVQVALAEFGPPPVGSFSIVTQGSGSGPTSTGSPGTETPPPTDSGGGGGRLSAPSGVHLTIDGKTGVRLQWTPVQGATSYVAQCKLGGPNGTGVNGPFTVTAPVANFGHLSPKRRYTALIWPGDPSDPGGPGSSQPHTEYSFTTT